MDSLKDKILKNLSYTSRDYESILGDLIDFIKGEDSVIGWEWDNVSEADPLFLILHLLAAHTDILNYMIDYRTLEGYMSTARERASMVRIANSVGYKIPSYKPAVAYLDVIDGLGETSTPLERFTVAKEVDENSFWIYIGDSIEINENSVELPFAQGRKESIAFSTETLAGNNTKGITDRSVAIGSKTPYQTSRLFETTGSTITEWTEVDSVIGRGNDEKVYELDVDTLGITYIKFPQGFNETLSLVFEYIITDGSSITKFPTKGVTIGNITFNQESNTTFVRGSDPATAEEVREGYKLFFNTSNALVTLDDYKNYIINKQTALPNVIDCLIIDGTADTKGGFKRGENHFDKGQIGVYVAVEGDDLSFDIPENTTALQTLLDNFKVSGLEIFINKDKFNTSIYQSLFDIKLVSRAASQVTEEDKAQLKNIIKKYLKGVGIGGTISAWDLEQAILDSEVGSIFKRQGLRAFIWKFNENEEPDYVEELELLFWEFPHYNTLIIEAP